MTSFANVPDTVPLLPPPPGVKSNFDHPDSQATALIVTNAVFLTLNVVMVGVRVCSRHWLMRMKIGWDDVLCVIATCGSIVHTTLMLNAINVGYGKHMWDIRLKTLQFSKLRLLTATDLVYVVTIYLVKLSLLLMFQRIFNIAKSARILIYCGIFMITIITIPYMSISIYRVDHCEGIAALSVQLCKSNTVRTTNITFGVLNIVTDFYILAVPLTQLSQLQIAKRRKFGLFVPFLLGLVAASMSIARLAIIITTGHSGDTLWNAARTSQFSIVEMKLAIICSCTIFFPAFYKSSKGVAKRSYGYLLSRTGRGSDRSRSTLSLPSTPKQASQTGASDRTQKRQAFESTESDVSLVPPTTAISTEPKSGHFGSP